MTRWNVSPEPRRREPPAKDSQDDKDARREEFWRTVQTLITKKLCVQCRRKPFNSDKHLVCKDCTRRLKLEECVHCGEEFYSAKPSQGFFRQFNRLMCCQCGFRILESGGEPVRCLFCRQWNAFPPNRGCDRCEKGLRDVGEPLACDGCGKKAAFQRRPDDQLLCHLCSVRYENMRRKHQLSGLENASPKRSRVEECADCQTMKRRLDDLRSRLENEVVGRDATVDRLEVETDRLRRELDAQSAKATNAETERVLVERRLREELDRLDRLRKEQEDVISELQEQRSAAEKKAKHQYHKARKENQQLSEHLSTYKTQTLAKTEELFDWMLGSVRKVIKEKAEVEDRLKEVQARLERSDSESRPLISDSVSEPTESSDEEDPASAEAPVRETDGSSLDDVKQLPETSEEQPEASPEPSDSDATETPDEGAFDESTAPA